MKLAFIIALILILFLIAYIYGFYRGAIHGHKTTLKEFPKEKIEAIVREVTQDDYHNYLKWTKENHEN